MKSTDNASRTGTFPRRLWKGFTIAAVIAASIAVSAVGSYAVARSMSPRFPLVYSEKLQPAATEGVAIADPSAALTFARVDALSGTKVLAVTRYENSLITGSTSMQPLAPGSPNRSQRSTSWVTPRSSGSPATPLSRP